MTEPVFTASATNVRPLRGANVIAVASGKGGVGKTWFSITLAHALARSGRNALLFDGDLGLANVDIQLGFTPKNDLGAVINGEIGEPFLRGAQLALKRPERARPSGSATPASTSSPDGRARARWPSFPPSACRRCATTFWSWRATTTASSWTWAPAWTARCGRCAGRRP